MPKEQNNRKCWTKYLTRTFGVLILSVFIIVATIHLWLIPAKVTQQIERALLKFWDGRVNIEDIDINYSDPIHLTKITFSDKTGWEYIRADKVKMQFEKWPGLHPVVTGIEIEKLCIQFAPADGKVALPVKNPYKKPKPRSKKKKLDIRTLSINDIEIILTSPKDTTYIYNNLQLLVNKTGGSHNFLLNRKNAGPSESLLAKGKIDLKTFETNLSLQIKHTVQKPETALLLTALNIPHLSAEGDIEADLTIIGPLKQPAELKPQGFITLDKWTVAVNDKTIASDLTAKADIKNKHFSFNKITAAGCGGEAVGAFYVEIKQDKPTEFNGQVLAENISFEELTSVLGKQESKAAKGTVAFDYAFAGKAKNLQNLTGEGQLFLDDADISTIPILPHIFNTVGLSELEPLKVSDAECAFTNTGPVVTIQTANVANRFAAVRAEPGGTINLKTKQIDMHVKAVLVKQIDAIIKKIPVIKIINNLKDKLTRLHIQGKWSDPPGKLVKKEPMTDIKEATVGFFQDIIKSGGQLTRKIRPKPAE